MCIDCYSYSAKFDEAAKSPQLNVTDDGSLITATCGEYQYACLDVGFSEGVAIWEMKLVNDTLNDECSCFGAAVKPVTNPSYSSSTQLYMYRCYNGNLYQKGKQLSKRYNLFYEFMNCLYFYFTKMC